ncbi:MAG: hypothetical protein RSA96_03835 [Erysipelotrichaceae bacterium]
MRRTLGILISLIGILLLIKPDYPLRELIENSSSFMNQYWPVLLILIGLYVQPKNKSRRSKKYRS